MTKITIDTLDYEILDNKIEATIFLDPKLEYFKGHFDSIALLPGVVQMSFFSMLLNKLLNKEVFIKKIIVTKFIAPLFPNDSVVFKVALIDKNKALFEAYKGNILVTTAKVLLC